VSAKTSENGMRVQIQHTVFGAAQDISGNRRCCCSGMFGMRVYAASESSGITEFVLFLTRRNQERLKEPKSHQKPNHGLFPVVFCLNLRHPVFIKTHSSICNPLKIVDT